MLGVSLGELAVIGLVALLVLGPERLPGAMRTMGQWLGRLRKLTSQVRIQSGIDEALRREGLTGGLSELRAIVRGDMGVIRHHFESPMVQQTAAINDPYLESIDPDPTREYPVEGCDAGGALADDLVDSTTDFRASTVSTAVGQP